MTQTKRIFLASSAELQEDRKEFETFINRKNKDWVDQGVFIELIVWEDFLDAVSKTRLQDEYNNAIRECDIFVMLFWTKVGPYTEEEFETAFRQFKATNKPFIFTYFKDTEISAGSANKKDLISLRAFQDKLDTLGHFKTIYKNIDQLKFHFHQQLDKLAKNGFIELKWDKDEAAVPNGINYQATLTGSGAIAQGPGATAVGAGGVNIGSKNTGNVNTGTQTNIDTGGGAYIGGSAHAGRDFVGRDKIVNVTVQSGKQPPSAPFQAPPPAADHVQRPQELAQLKGYLLDGSGQLLPNTVGLHGFGGAGKTTLARLFCADAAVKRAATAFSGCPWARTRPKRERRSWTW